MEKELDVLENIFRNEPGIKQRDLAKVLGLSLGMINAIIKRLAKKGWLKVTKINNKMIKYAVSPEGMKVIAKKSYKYFKRTIKNVAFYKEAIEEVIGGVRESGYQKLALIGKSDLEFIVEHLCLKYGIGFSIVDYYENKQTVYYLCSENFLLDQEYNAKTNISHLKDILLSPKSIKEIMK